MWATELLYLVNAFSGSESVGTGGTSATPHRLRRTGMLRLSHSRTPHRRRDGSYDATGQGREKSVDVRIAIDLTRLGVKGLYDVAIVISEDSDLDEAVKDVYALRDEERWIAVENALPWSPQSHTRWLPSAKRRRRIDQQMFDIVRDDASY